MINLIIKSLFLVFQYYHYFKFDFTLKIRYLIIFEFHIFLNFLFFSLNLTINQIKISFIFLIPKSIFHFITLPILDFLLLNYFLNHYFLI